jgi:hypothetical protein
MEISTQRTQQPRQSQSHNQVTLYENAKGTEGYTRGRSLAQVGNEAQTGKTPRGISRAEDQMAPLSAGTRARDPNLSLTV